MCKNLDAAKQRSGQLEVDEFLGVKGQESFFAAGYVIPLGPGRAMSREMYGSFPFFLHCFMSSYRSWGLKNKISVMCDLLKGVLRG